MTRALSRILQILAALIFLIVLAAQILILPIVAKDAAAYAPEFAFLRWPILIQAELFLTSIQVGLVALWALLSRVRKNEIFDRAALRWVDVIIAAASAATILVWVTLVPVVTVTNGPPGLSLMILAGGTAGIAFTLLVVVMRELLVQACSLRSEMDEVI